MSDKERNPLLTLWNVLGTVGGIISLSSMAQTWVDDLVKWKGFILTIIESYHAIVRPFTNFVFQWFPFSVPYWVHDYIVFGVIVAVSEFRASRKRRKDVYYSGLLGVVAWPFILAGYPKRIHLYYKRRKRPTFIRHNPQIEFSHNSIMWISANILGCIVLFSINAAL